MTLPTPIAAKSASPPSCRAGLAAGSLALALSIALATATQAQIIPTGSPAADILLTQALGEHRVFLTCSSLDGLSHPLILQNWQREVSSAVDTLTAHDTPPEAISAFTEAAKPENLLPAEDTPYSEVKQFCDANPDWQTLYAQLNWTILNLKLPRVFE